MWPFSMHHYHHEDEATRQLFGYVLDLIKLTRREVKQIMATLEEVNAKLLEVAEKVATESAEVAAKVDGLKAEVQALRDQIAAGTAATPEQLDGVIAALDSIGLSVSAITEAA